MVLRRFATGDRLNERGDQVFTTEITEGTEITESKEIVLCLLCDLGDLRVQSTS